MFILVINCGSSSAKYQLFDLSSHRSVARGMVERIGQRGANLRHQNNGAVRIERQVKCADHAAAIGIIVDALTDIACGVLTSVSQISGIGHRVVHGGEEFKESTLITPRVIASIARYSELAPLHNPPSLLGIKACSKILAGIPQVAVFDTSFHQTMEEKVFLYGLPYRYYTDYGIRRYGFHGTSHRYVAQEAPKVLGKNAAKLKIITCHLGNGCSMAAVKGGRVVDTSMGFTPLEGLIMGTRSGDIDPAIVLHLLEKGKLSPAAVNDVLNKKSGLLGITGESNDMRDLLRAMRQGGTRGARAKLTLEMFIYRIEKYIGAYQAAMGGLDAVIFTAGIGENNPWLVKRIARDLKNVLPRTARCMVIPTNEELLIARDTYAIIRRMVRQNANNR